MANLRGLFSVMKVPVCAIGARYSAAIFGSASDRRAAEPCSTKRSAFKRWRYIEESWSGRISTCMGLRIEDSARQDDHPAPDVDHELAGGSNAVRGAQVPGYFIASASAVFSAVQPLPQPSWGDL